MDYYLVIHLLIFSGDEIQELVRENCSELKKAAPRAKNVIVPKSQTYVVIFLL